MKMYDDVIFKFTIGALQCNKKHKTVDDVTSATISLGIYYEMQHFIKNSE